MTLVISKVSRRFVMQVSDRLLTDAISRSPFDRAANKTVIYFARDAYVTISYSGLAYLDGKTTDQWIAERLAGQDLTPPPGGPGGHGGTLIRVGDTFRTPDIGLSIRLLRDELALAMARMPTTQRWLAPQLVIAGWQRGKRLWRPILYYLCDLGNGPLYSGFGWSMRHGWERGMFYLDFVPRRNALHPSEIRALDERFRLPHTADEAETLMGQHIQLAADRSLVIGKDYLSVLLPPPGERIVRTRYFAAEAHSRLGPIDSANLAAALGRPYDGALDYSPWIVSPHIISSPSLVIGSAGWTVGDFLVSVEGPPSPDPGRPIMFFLSQYRPPSSGRPRRTAAFLVDPQEEHPGSRFDTVLKRSPDRT